jgi:hypothetical protein
MDEEKFVVAADLGLSIRSLEDINDLIGQSYGSSGLLLTEQDVALEFFDLHSGWAGELFQKCTNYHVRLALVLPHPEKYGERVSELTYEHRRHKLIRFFDTDEDARVWLNTKQD